MLHGAVKLKGKARCFRNFRKQRAFAYTEGLALTGQLLLIRFDHLLDHLTANRTGLTGCQIAVIALLEVDADLPWCGITTKTSVILQSFAPNRLASPILKIDRPIHLPYRVGYYFSDEPIENANALPVRGTRSGNDFAFR